MKTYVFRVTIDPDAEGRWAASCPALPGCATWGRSREEALRNIREAVEVYVEDLVEAGDPIPDGIDVIDDVHHVAGVVAVASTVTEPIMPG